MKEKMTYEEMISLLQHSRHKAESSWQTLAEELDLEDNLELLPAHEVERDLWKGIEASLPPEHGNGKNRTIRIFAFLRYAAILIFLLITANYFFTNINEDPFVYHSEIEIGQQPITLPQHDEAAIEKAKAFINENNFLFSEELINEFQNELAQLESDIAAIKSMQESYGIEEAEIKMISKMERQKAAIIKSMLNRQ